MVMWGRGLIVFIRLFRPHRQPARKSVRLHNKLDMGLSSWDRVGLRGP